MMSDSQPPSLANLAYEKLEAMIVGQQLQAGALVTEGQLIAALDMGRTPVREAMQRLAWEGLIEVRPRAGIKVTEIHADDFIKVLNLRLALEPLLVSAAVRNATATHRTNLAPLRHAISRPNVINDIAAFVRWDKEFDAYLSAAANDMFLTKALAPLQTHSRRYWYRFVALGGLSETVRLHLPIVDACLAGNEAAAVSAMKALLAGMLANADDVLRKTG